MQVAIAGAHGKVAMRLTRRLAGRGEKVVGLIRNPAHADDVHAAGGEAVVCDLERVEVAELAAAISGSDAAVFAAGAGPGSGAERKFTMDRDGAVKLLAAASAAGVPRYLIISSIGAEDAPQDDDVFSAYLRAKAEADAAVQASDRDWVILRPGRLVDEPGRGRVRLDTEPFHGQVSRDDLAAVLDALLQRAVARLTLYVNGGEDPLEEALEECLRQARQAGGER
jgi:nucleoside-diphosphate-sugar epimerase